MGHERKIYSYAYELEDGRVVEEATPFSTLYEADRMAIRLSDEAGVRWAQAGFVDPKTGRLIRNGRRRKHGR